jgi:hypothetical protein
MILVAGDTCQIIHVDGKASHRMLFAGSEYDKNRGRIIPERAWEELDTSNYTSYCIREFLVVYSEGRIQSCSDVDGAVVVLPRILSSEEDIKWCIRIISRFHSFHNWFFHIDSPTKKKTGA